MHLECQLRPEAYGRRRGGYIDERGSRASSLASARPGWRHLQEPRWPTPTCAYPIGSLRNRPESHHRVIKAWIESGSSLPLRAQVRLTTDMSIVFGRRPNTTDPDVIMEIVQAWLSVMVAHSLPWERAEGSVTVALRSRWGHAPITCAIHHQQVDIGERNCGGFVS
jgi:hypothetical protein